MSYRTGSVENHTIKSQTAAVAMLAVTLFAPHAGAQMPDDHIPPELLPWVGWVLRGHETELCPFALGAPESTQCIWPSTLNLAISPTGAAFNQQVRVFAKSFVPLPGGTALWPQEAKLDGQPAAVIAIADRPCVEATAGTHLIAGIFQWDSPPESIQIPPETGLLAITTGGRRIDFPQRDEQGRLWLQREQVVEEGEAREEIVVHRMLIDGVPIELMTRIQMKVSGRNREVRLGKVLPDGIIPMSLSSPLPARLEADGHMRVQVRPGTWDITVRARAGNAPEAVTLHDPQGPWDPDEVWVTVTNPSLREIEIEGPPAVDPQQTELPGEWRQYPAYLMRTGSIMKIVERRRGEATPDADRLNLSRTYWLDFDGEGFTVSDRISGQLTRSSRIDMLPGMQLGRMSVNGQDQFITSRAKDGSAGIEIRERKVDAAADSRIDRRGWSVPAVGWNQEFERVSAELHLPPGWRLLHAFGVDGALPSWVTSWTGLDLILVFLAALALFKLRSARFALLTFAGLILTWHEPGAPHIAWFLVIAAEALDRLLKRGSAAKVSRAVRVASGVVLLLVAVPFLVATVWHGVYPQTETIEEGPGLLAGLLDMRMPAGTYSARPEIMMQQEAPAAPEPPRELIGLGYASKEDVARSSISAADSDKKYKVRAAYRQTYAPDPKAQVSTGPGLPSWRWRSVRLVWEGPISPDHRIRLLLTPPWMTALIAIAGAVLVLVLALKLAGLPPKRESPPFADSARQAPPDAAMAAGLSLLAVLGFAQAAYSEIPSPEILAELQKRLLEKPQCAPNCAQSPRAHIEAMPERLRIRFEVDAAAQIAVPLPGGARLWEPSTVVVDGNNAPPLWRSPDGVLWVALARGSHTILLDGPLPQSETVQVPLPLRPYRASSSGDGWLVDGIHEDGTVEGTIQLTRSRVAAQPGPAGRDSPQQELPPFVQVERHLSIGLSWNVETIVTRLTPVGVPIVIDVPLLAGESITTESVRADAGMAHVSMGPQVSEVRWQSSLAESASIELRATANSSWVEAWFLDASPIWHAETKGVPPVMSLDSDAQRIPEWRPWPGESIAVAISRPEGVPGQTLTIDESRLQVRPGARTSDQTLTMRLRSSRAAKHMIELPEGAELVSVQIDSVKQHARLDGRSVPLQILPGTHTAEITWKQEAGMSMRYRTPDVNVNAPSVNSNVLVSMPGGRWTIALDGPSLGPAVMIWSLFGAIVLIAYGLKRLDLTPLSLPQWIVLGAGLSQIPLPLAAAVPLWLLAIGMKRRRAPEDADRHNLLQIVLVVTTIIAMICLAGTAVQLLTGSPQMRIDGNGSSGSEYRWYQDRASDVLRGATVISLPLAAFRLVALAWVIWLVASLLGWLKWGWSVFSERGVWRGKPRPDGTEPPPGMPMPPPPPAA